VENIVQSTSMKHNHRDGKTEGMLKVERMLATQGVAAIGLGCLLGRQSDRQPHFAARRKDLRSPLTLVIAANGASAARGAELPVTVQADRILLDAVPGEAPITVTWQNAAPQSQ